MAGSKCIETVCIIDDCTHILAQSLTHIYTEYTHKTDGGERNCKADVGEVTRRNASESNKAQGAKLTATLNPEESLEEREREKESVPCLAGVPLPRRPHTC